MKLSFHYDVSAHTVLSDPEFPKKLSWMKHAGVDRLWLFGYYYGRHDSSPEQMKRARRLLEEEGFQTGVLSLPVGHPGNSLNPDDPNLELSIHPAWRYRVGRNGEKEYFSACIEETMIAHNRAAAMEYAQMGFTRHFFDDDLRMGNYGKKIRGCFCASCLEAFNRQTGLALTRPLLVAAIDTDEQIREAWMQYNCDKVTGFMRDTQIPGMTSGFMIMPSGDRRHGISIPDIKKAVPDCMFRVGEFQYDDKSFTSPEGRALLIDSAKKHLELIGTNEAYSECTVFPANALSPENWIEKMRLEIRMGLRNIFLMSGTWFFSEPYWNALKNALPELYDLADLPPEDDIR